jgi:hypothetical protein
LSNDELHPQSAAPGGYISLVARIWVGDDGELIRGTIEDVHTGARLAFDLSAFTAFLRASLEDALKNALATHKEREAQMMEEQQSELREERPPDADGEDGPLAGEPNGEEEGM